MTSTITRRQRPLASRLLGGTVPAPLRPVVTTYFVRVVGGSAIVSYQGVWAAERLGVRGGQLGVFLAAAAVAGVGGGYIGGRVSDTAGRRPVMLAGYAVAAVCLMLAAVAGHRAAAALALVVAFAAAYAIGNAAHYALAADVVPGDAETAFAVMRAAQNLGVVLGPVAASLLVAWSWFALLAGAAAVVGSAAAFGCRRLPEPPRPERDRSSQVTTRGLLHDHRFLAFSAANLLAACAYAAYETLLPVSATTHHGLDPSHLGLLLAINPAMVVALQLRVTRWSQHLRPALKLPVASALMGLPFLALSAGRGPVVLAAVIVVFVLGEMLWVPASSAAVIRLAPSQRRGGYLGAFNATTPLALVLMPLAGFPLADAAGDGAMWALVAGIGVAGGAAFALLLTGSAGTAHERGRQSPDHHDGEGHVAAKAPPVGGNPRAAGLHVSQPEAPRS